MDKIDRIIYEIQRGKRFIVYREEIYTLQNVETAMGGMILELNLERVYHKWFVPKTIRIYADDPKRLILVPKRALFLRKERKERC